MPANTPTTETFSVCVCSLCCVVVLLYLYTVDGEWDQKAGATQTRGRVVRSRSLKMSPMLTKAHVAQVFVVHWTCVCLWLLVFSCFWVLNEIEWLRCFPDKITNKYNITHVAYCISAARRLNLDWKPKILKRISNATKHRKCSGKCKIKAKTSLTLSGGSRVITKQEL